MLKKLTKNKLVLVALVVVVAAGAWYMLSGNEGDGALLTSNATGTTNAAEREILSTLLELRGITLDGAILTDQAFLSLEDYSTEIVSEPVGRRNPFAPLSAPSAPTPGSGTVTP